MNVDNREFSRALFEGNTKKLQSYFDSGLDCNELTEKERWNFLHRSTVSISLPINLDTLEFLIQKGTDVNQRDVYQNTPLHYAARNKNVEALSLLLKSGANVNGVNSDGVSPLHETLLKKPFNSSATELLLTNGANPEQQIGSSTIRKFVETISHGEDIVIKKLFDQYPIGKK